MTRHSADNRVLGIAPISKGFGYAVLDGPHKLADWGLKITSGDKNAGVIAHARRLIIRYRPDCLSLQDYWAHDSSRGERIKRLGGGLIALAESHDVKVRVFSKENLYRKLIGDSSATKPQVALFLTTTFNEELARFLPPNRKFWKSEDLRMAIFDAVGLALRGYSK